MLTRIWLIDNYYGNLWVKSDKDKYYMLMEDVGRNVEGSWIIDYDEWDEITEALYNELIKLNK